MSDFIKTPTAGIDSEFDPTGTDLTSTDVESAIKELATTVGVSASPGFSWGRSGNVTNNTWLLNDSVPSNKAGRTIALTSPEITKVFVGSENVDTYDVEIYEHQGDEVGLTLLGTVNVVAQRAAEFTVSFSATQGEQLALKLVNGSAKNLVAGLQLKGNA